MSLLLSSANIAGILVTDTFNDIYE
jgi:hypothetical protein